MQTPKVEYFNLPNTNTNTNTNTKIENKYYICSIHWVPSNSYCSTSTILVSKSSSLQTFSLSPSLIPISTFPLSSPFTSLSLSNNILSFSDSHSVQFLDFSFKPLANFQIGNVEDIDINASSCVCVGQYGSIYVVNGDYGNVHLVNLQNGDNGNNKVEKVWDSDGLVGYNAVKWASSTEFVTGGLGFGLQWWDLRKPGGPASQFKGFRPHQRTSGVVHSIDIHPSRKHTCLAGGSAGAVFAWDLRWQHQPIVLSGVGLDEKLTHSPSESEVWKVQYDNYTSSLNMGSISSSRILPAMICSEDGILAVVEEGEEPYELLAEPCAINSFDINPENPSDVVCALEWESIAVVTRP